jgi:hypothetical protein
MSEFGFGKRLCRFTVVFMGIFPVVPMFVLCSCKDSILGLAFVLWLVEAYDWICNGNEKSCLRWVIWSVLMCLLRYNVVYALVATGIITAICMKNHRGRTLVMFAVSVIVSMVISSGLEYAFNATSDEHQELLTVPIQQIARTYNLSPDTFTEEEKEVLYNYIPEEYLLRYRAKLSDLVKVGFDNGAYENDSGGFWNIWLSGLRKSPVSYLNAWLMTSYGYWYPDTVIDVYSGNNVQTFTYGESSYFGYETEYPGTRASLIPVIDKFYRSLSLDIYKEKLPVVSMLFSTGFVLWLFVFCVGYIVRQGGFKAALPYVLPFFIVGTLLLGPTYLTRYVFFIWISLPFVVGNMLSFGRPKTPPHTS